MEQNLWQAILFAAFTFCENNFLDFGLGPLFTFEISFSGSFPATGELLDPVTDGLVPDVLVQDEDLPLLRSLVKRDQDFVRIFLPTLPSLCAVDL